MKIKMINNKTIMKASITGLLLILLASRLTFAQNPAAQTFTKEEQEIVTLSKDKWQWMADKSVDPLNDLFHEKSMFVHMGGSWGKTREIEVIKSGGIWYKKADVHEVIVNFVDKNTAILLNRITLVAEVGGNEVTTHFMVTEVYVKPEANWKLGSLTFSRLSAPPPQ
jgi:hypothetical protein